MRLHDTASASTESIVDKIRGGGCQANERDHGPGRVILNRLDQADEEGGIQWDMFLFAVSTSVDFACRGKLRLLRLASATLEELNRIQQPAIALIVACVGMAGEEEGTHAIQEAKMIWKRRHDPRGLFVGDFESDAVEKGPGFQHGPEVRRLRQIQSVVLLRVEQRFHDGWMRRGALLLVSCCRVAEHRVLRSALQTMTLLCTIMWDVSLFRLGWYGQLSC